VIDAIDLQLVRRLVHGAADQETPDVDPEVARFLAALWAGIDPGRSLGDWRRLFVAAAANYLGLEHRGLIDPAEIDASALHAALRSRLDSP
jgi:hypothetical protein